MDYEHRITKTIANAVSENATCRTFQYETCRHKNQCGTAMCIAGHALDLAGYKFKFNELGFEAGLYTPKGRRSRIGTLQAAAKVMGLNYYGTAYYLFHEFNLKTPKQAAARIQELIDSAEQFK